MKNAINSIQDELNDNKNKLQKEPYDLAQKQNIFKNHAYKLKNKSKAQ
jgi:hypothetical protein